MSIHVGTPPQSEDEIERVRVALRTRCNDPLLDLRWNAEAFVQDYGSLDAVGRPLNPKHEGRWQVVRFETDRLHLEREFAVIMTVTLIDPPSGARKYPCMYDKGPYMPLDDRIIEYVQLCNRAQGRLADEMLKETWAEHDRVDAPDDDRAAHQEGLEKVYREHGGGAYWMGGAQGTADPRTAESLWPPLNPSLPMP